MPFGVPKWWVVRVPLRMIHFFLMMMMVVDRSGVGSGVKDSVVVVGYKKGVCF